MASVLNGKRDRVHILGVPVSLVNMNRAVELLLTWGRSGAAQTVFLRDVHGIMRAVQEPALLTLHHRASLVVPDGTPLTWVARLRGFGDEISRVAGADLMAEVCRVSVENGLSHYFYGGKRGVAERMAARLAATYPGLRVVGIHSPPMREVDATSPLSPDELQEIESIENAAPDFIWVGLSSPKQEYWIMKAASRLPHGVLLGVGAAFDFHSATVARAPAWMRNNGLEWLHRLLSEPRRLWRRYLLLAPQFVFKATIEQVTGAWKSVPGGSR